MLFLIPCAAAVGLLHTQLSRTVGVALSEIALRTPLLLFGAQRTHAIKKAAHPATPMIRRLARVHHRPTACATSSTPCAHCPPNPADNSPANAGHSRSARQCVLPRSIVRRISHSGHTVHLAVRTSGPV
ncbi:hypothetical protein DFH06DRAFT_324133 [Mycena polygramma]|nr:hypothetical protein DFH06DRAFT_324133 [Mycena polygramma]